MMKFFKITIGLVSLMFLILVVASFFAAKSFVSNYQQEKQNEIKENCILIKNSGVSKTDSDPELDKILDIHLELINRCEDKKEKVVIALYEESNNSNPVLVLEENVSLPEKGSRAVIDKRVVTDTSVSVGLQKTKFKVLSFE